MSPPKVTLSTVRILTCDVFPFRRGLPGGSSAAGYMVRALVRSRSWWRGSAELPVPEPGAWGQPDSLGAEDFGHAPEGLVQLDIFIDACDGSALGHSAPVWPATRVVALTTADNVFLNLCGAQHYWTVFKVVQRSLAPSPKRRGLRSIEGLTGALLRSSHR
jgi:hypothetical protein